MASTLTKMLISFRDRPTDPAAVVSIYVEILSPYGEAIVNEASGRFMRGVVGDRNNAYAPSTAEVAEECDRIRIDQLRRSARATEGPREVLKPIRQTWMLHPSWADLTRPPPDRKPS